jgi:RNA polymerase sigma-70 factor (ECF subfamily)
VVQEILLAIHLKRQTWMQDQPFLPWLNAIARHKLIDVLRRRGRRGEVPIENLIEILPDAAAAPETSQSELNKLVGRLDGKQQTVVSSIALDGHSIRDTASSLRMSEGAVRVAFHRGLKKLASLYREEGA